jgi:nucleoside-diphosphate-sugar epimerase
VAGLTGRPVLVTGANGFIGRHLVKRLVADGATVHALTRRPAPDSPATIHTIAVPLEDLTPEHWTRHGIGAFDTVFHLGGFIPRARQDADDIDANFASNLLGTKALLQSLSAPPRRLVFVSTVDVYAPMQPDSRLSESSPVDASNMYAGSKMCGERMAIAWGLQSGVEVAVLRYGHVYGPGEGAFHKLIPHTIRTLLDGRNPAVYGDGSAERDCIYVADAVEATIRCATREQVPPGPVNIVSGVSFTIAEIVRRVVNAAGSTAAIERRPSTSADRSFRFDNSAMRTHFGTWEMTTLDEGLRAEIDDVRNGGR